MHISGNAYRLELKGESMRKRRFVAHLKQIWLQPDRKSARRAAAQLAQEYGDRFPDAIGYLEEGLEDSLILFFSSPLINASTISGSNCLPLCFRSSNMASAGSSALR